MYLGSQNIQVLKTAELFPTRMELLKAWQEKWTLDGLKKIEAPIIDMVYRYDAIPKHYHTDNQKLQW